MESLQERTYDRLWTAAYGEVKLDDLSPHCIIDNTAYGAGTVSWRVRRANELASPSEGTRTAGLRPRHPDEHLQKVHADFYAKLQGSVERIGIKVPVLLWEINGRLYTRYGASRIFVAGRLHLRTIPAIVASYSHQPERAFTPPEVGGGRLNSAMDILRVLGNVKNVGCFEVSHEKLDIHNVEPWF